MGEDRCSSELRTQRCTACRFALPAAAQKRVKIGFVATFTGPTAVIGNDMRDAFELALDHLGRKMGGLPVNVIYEDDQQKPDIGKQKTDKLIQSDKVNFLTGYIWSNVLLASLKSAVDAETFLISANAGPSQIAGELCSPWFFSTSWQGDQVPQAIGEYLNQKGVKSAYLIAPNYAAGKDVIAGRESEFQGQGCRRGLHQMAGPARFLRRAVQGARRQAGRDLRILSGRRRRRSSSRNMRRPACKAQIPLYTAFIIDAVSLPRLKDLALGVPGAQHWVNDLPNEANKKFVADFQEKYNRDPAFYAAQAYDAAHADRQRGRRRSTATSARRTRCATRCARRILPRCAARTDTATTTSRSRISTCRKR